MNVNTNKSNISFEALKIKNLKQWSQKDSYTLNKFLDNEHVQVFSKKYDVKADFVEAEVKDYAGEKEQNARIDLYVKPLNSWFSFAKKITINKPSPLNNDSTKEGARELLNNEIDNLDSVTLINKYYQAGGGEKINYKEAKNKLDIINKG